MFISKNFESFSLFHSKWIKLLFILTICTVFFSSCEDEVEPTEQQRIEGVKKAVVGMWEFSSSKITTPLAPEENTDYRNIKSTLGAVGRINGSKLQLNEDNTYKFTNTVIGGGTYVITGNWELRKNDGFKTDFIELEGFYDQLLDRLDADRDFFNTIFAKSFDNFQILSSKKDEIMLSNNAIINEESATGEAPPTDIAVEGNYTIVRK